MVIAAAEGDEELLAIAEAVGVVLGAKVGLPLLLKAVLAQPAQPGVAPKVEEAAKVAAYSEAALVLIENCRDAALVKGEEEHEAARATADARGWGLSGILSLRSF